MVRDLRTSMLFQEMVCIVVLWSGCGCSLEEGTMEGGSWYVKGSKGVVG